MSRAVHVRQLCSEGCTLYGASYALLTHQSKDVDVLPGGLVVARKGSTCSQCGSVVTYGALEYAYPKREPPNHGGPGWDRQVVPDGPHGWIQWKGSTVCMDLMCECGASGHVDADFAYFYRCAVCGRVSMISGYVNLVLLTDEEQSEIIASSSMISIAQDDEAGQDDDG